MDWQLEQGKRYRLWYRDETPMPDIIVFERVAQKAATTAPSTTLHTTTATYQKSVAIFSI